MDFYATSYSLAHNKPAYKPNPPLIRNGTGFIRSLVPTGDIGVMAGAEVKALTSGLCRSALPERHPPWVMHDGREPLPATVNDSSASGYASNATPTHQLVKFPKDWRQADSRAEIFPKHQPLARQHLAKNEHNDYVSEYHAIFKQKPFHGDLSGTRCPENPEIICSTGFTHERGAEGGPQARHFATPPTAYLSYFSTAPLGPGAQLPSTNTDTRDVGTGYPNQRPVTVAGQLRPPQTKHQEDFGNPADREPGAILLPTKINSSGFNSNNPIKQLQLDRRTFCTDYTEAFADRTPQGADREGHTTGNITARVQTFYPLASFRHRYQDHGDAEKRPERQAYPQRSWAARSGPGTIGAQRSDGPLAEVAG
ncbi:hypothetical protein FJT64_022248 [Amphibalanus amphitrite]|uniref:Protein phosphatase 1 regulatory subunit 32 n=1 Tax=Amphibalanus amphitrite TaxID=1232801 RepID=A0A6A4WF11_AMPAM|nr:hypothetical protein FJT64_022248 [Amphibalanus amphitrite]